MGTIRKIKKVIKGRSVVEGAGVHLKRALGNDGAESFFDPFLLMDDFHSSKPDDYLPGFPWHPYRGIETITYVIRGEVDRGGAINTITPHKTTSKNATGMVSSSFLVEVEKVTPAQMEEWKKKYPLAFERKYDAAQGLCLDAHLAK